MIADVEAFLRGRLRGVWQSISGALAETGPVAAQYPANTTKGMTSARLGVSWPAVNL
jgi:hypothetical protein